jgi:hypothetical protein
MFSVSLSEAPPGPIFLVSVFSSFVGPEHIEFARELPQIDVMHDDPATIVDDEKIADMIARRCRARFPQHASINCKTAGETLIQRSLRERYEEGVGLSARHRHRLRVAMGFLAAQPDVGRPMVNHDALLPSEVFLSAWASFRRRAAQAQ